MKCALAALGTSALINSFASAVTYTWNGANVTWNVAGNWQGGVPTSFSTTDLLFTGQGVTGTSGAPLNQNVATSLKIRSITFDNLASAFFLGGNGFDINDGNITFTQSSSNAQSIANAITHPGNTNTVRTLVLGGNGSGIVTYSGLLSDSNGNRKITINKTGTSTYVLTNANTHDNGTTIDGGVLRITNTGALGGGSVNINAGTLEISGVNLTANDLNLNNGATLLGTGAASYSKSGFPSIASGASVTLGTSASTDTLTIGSGYSNAVGSTITPTMNIDNPGGGRVILNSGAGAFRGSWVINSGTLQTATNGNNTFGIGNASGGLVGSTVTLAGGNLEVRGTADTTYNAGTVGAEVGMKVNASGTVAAGRSSNGAGVTHTFGALTLGNNSNVNATFTHTAAVNSGTASFAFGAVTLNGDATVTVAKPSGSVTSQVMFGAIGQTGGTRSFTKSGPGMLTLTGTSAYAGTTSVNNGTLRVNGTLDSSGGLVTVSATTPDTATLGGTGSINRSVTIGDRGQISPGAGDFSLANFNVDQASTTTTFDAGGTYVWQTNALPSGGTAGTNWDKLSLSGLSVAASSGSKFTIKVVSVNAGGTAIGSIGGLGANGTKHTWTIATANDGITGFDVSKFALDTSQFNNNVAGQWSLETNGGDLRISVTVPEPASVSLLGITTTIAMLRRHRRRTRG